ncbi:MAG TPA: LysR family transcriptional regulator [Burkholderiaceae bacterium]
MSLVPQRPLVLDHLRSFEAVARRAGFGAAAQELHVTQSAVSRQIKSLEEELGAPLFTRGTRRVELTQAGQLLLRAITPALSRIDSAVRQIRQQRGRAQVSLSTFPSFASLWLLPRLPTFERQQKAIDIRITAIDRLIEIDDPDYDLLLRQCRPEDAPPGARRMFGEVLTPVIGASLVDAIARGAAPPLDEPADLAAHTLIAMEDDRPGIELLTWNYWLEQRGLGQLEPRRWISVNFTHQEVQTALAGQGVALARLPLIHDLLQRGDLVEPFGSAGRLASPHAYWHVPLPGARPRPELDSFMLWLEEATHATRVAIGESAG